MPEREIKIRIGTSYDGKGVDAALADAGRLQFGLKNNKPIELVPKTFTFKEGVGFVDPRGNFEKAVRQRIATELREMRNAARDQQIQEAAETTLFGAPRVREEGRKNAREAGAEQGKDYLHRLKESLGEERVLRGIFAGGIANFIGDKLAEAAHGIVELRDDLNEGKKSAAEMGLELAKGLPILGGWVAAGQSIRELMTGEAAEIRRINEEAERTNRIIDARLALMAAERDALRGQADEAERIRRARERINADATEQAAQDRKNALTDDLKRENDQAAKDRADITSKGDALKKQLAAETEAARRDLDRANNPQSTSALSGEAVYQKPDQGRVDAAQAKVNAAVAAQAKAEGELTAALAKFDEQKTANAANRRKQFAEEQAAAIDTALDDFFKPIEEVPDRLAGAGESIDRALEDFFGPIEQGAERAARAARDTAIATAEKKRDEVDAKIKELRQSENLTRGPAVLPNAQSSRLLTGITFASREAQPLSEIEKSSRKSLETLLVIKTQLDTQIQLLRNPPGGGNVVQVPPGGSYP